MYSSIQKKIYCECKPNCTALKSFGFGKFNYAHCPPEMRAEKGEKARKSYQNKLSRANKSNLTRKVHEAAKGVRNRFSSLLEPVMTPECHNSMTNKGAKTLLRSALLKKADKLFGDYVKNRDTDEQGNGICPCCGKGFNLEDKNSEEETTVNALHFVVRTVYTLRFDERNVWAGHGICNARQHRKPDGREYMNFKIFLHGKLSAAEVQKMEAAHRNINKLSNQDIVQIIKKYQL